jgi:hypothetical protein
LLTEHGSAYRFEPRSDFLRDAVEQLSEAYARGRVRVIDFLYGGGSDDRIKRFSDAFRFRGEED